MTQQCKDFVVVKVSQLIPGDVVVGTVGHSHNHKCSKKCNHELWSLVITCNHISREHNDVHHYHCDTGSKSDFPHYLINEITFLTLQGLHKSDICSTTKLTILKR